MSGEKLKRGRICIHCTKFPECKGTLVPDACVGFVEKYPNDPYERNISHYKFKDAGVDFQKFLQ